MAEDDRRQELFDLELDPVSEEEEEDYVGFVEQGFESRGDSRPVTRSIDDAIFASCWCLEK